MNSCWLQNFTGVDRSNDEFARSVTMRFRNDIRNQEESRTDRVCRVRKFLKHRIVRAASNGIGFAFLMSHGVQSSRRRFVMICVLGPRLGFTRCETAIEPSVPCAESAPRKQTFYSKLCS